MPKLTVDPRSVLAISPGRLNALRVLEDELQLLRQQSANHPEYLGLMPGMELEIARIRQATGTAAPEPQPELAVPELNSHKPSLTPAVAEFLNLIQSGPVTANNAAKALGTSANAITMKASGLRKAGYDIQCISGKYTLMRQPEKTVKSHQPAAPTGKSRSAIIREYAMSHKGIIDRAAIIAEHPQVATSTFRWIVNDLKTKHGWEIDSIGGGNYKVIKQGRIPHKPGGYQRKSK